MFFETSLFYTKIYVNKYVLVYLTLYHQVLIELKGDWMRDKVDGF